jgi:hypothetical protein
MPSVHESTSPSWNTSALAAFVFAFLCAVYMLSYSGVVTITDEVSLMNTAESLAKRGDFSQNAQYWRNGNVRIDPDVIWVTPQFEPLQPVLTAPLAWLALHLPHVGLIHLTTLFNVVVTALTAVVIMAVVRELGYSPGVSAACALVFGLCTIAFPYSKMFFREPLAGLLIALPILCFVLYERSRKPLYGLLCMLCLGAGYLDKEANLLIVPAFVVALIPATRGLMTGLSKRRTVTMLIPAALVVVVVVGWLAVLHPNLFAVTARTELAIRGLGGRLSNLVPVAQAIAGFLFSPGKSFFVFSPVALASVWAFPAFLRTQRTIAWLVGGIFILYIVGFSLGKTDIWWGGLNYGPRFLVPLAVLVPIPLASLFTKIAQSPSRRDTASSRARGGAAGLGPAALRQLISLAALLLASLYVQIIGVLLEIRVYGDALASIPGETRSNQISIWNPLYSPPVWALSMLHPDNWNFSWARYIWGHETPSLSQIDFRVLGLCLVFLCASALALGWQFGRRKPASRRLAVVAWCAVLLASAIVMGGTAYGIYDDPRFSGGADRLQLLKVLNKEALPQDILLLNDRTMIRFVMNYSHSSINWYTILADDELWNESQVLIDHVIRTNPRVWLMLSYAPNPRALRAMENYLTSHTYPIQQQVFSDYAQLALYSTLSAPDPVRAKQPANLQLGDSVMLSGFDLSNNHLAPVFAHGSYVQLSLLWQARRAMTQNYTVFVQLLAPDGHLVWQSDRQPVIGARPTSGWTADELVRDNYGFVVADEWPAGSYRLIAGMYELPSLKRLAVGGSSSVEHDYIDIASIEIQ